MAFRLINILLLMIIPVFFTASYGQTTEQNINILKAQVNAVQRALIDYQRINEEDIFPPTINKLIYENYLPPSNDVSYRDGIFNLFTLWQGEITVLVGRHFFYIQVARLPHKVCQRLLIDLRNTSPLSSCQGEMDNPIDWQLRIPVGNTRLFSGIN